MIEKSTRTKEPAPKPVVQKAKPAVKEKPKKENAIARWWRETLGELRKVKWPTMPEARRLTGIVLVVMFSMSALLGILDFAFSRLVAFILQ